MQKEKKEKKKNEEKQKKKEKYSSFGTIENSLQTLAGKRVAVSFDLSFADHPSVTSQPSGQKANLVEKLIASTKKLLLTEQGYAKRKKEKKKNEESRKGEKNILRLAQLRRRPPSKTASRL